MPRCIPSMRRAGAAWSATAGCAPESGLKPWNATHIWKILRSPREQMYREDGAGDQTCGAVCRGINALAERAGNLVVVTNEVFSDGIVYDPETERYLEYLGRINQYLARIADRVTEVVYGIPVCVKGMRR